MAPIQHAAKNATRSGFGGGIRQWVVRSEGVLIALSLIATALIASGWLAFPYLLEGRGVLAGVGKTIQQERQAKAVTVGQFLTRYASGPGNVDVDVLYATPKYFELADKARVVETYRPDRYHVFVVTETTHVDELPAELPKATLIVDGREYAPVDVEGPRHVVHHRAVTIRFGRFDAAGRSIVGTESKRLELRLSSGWDEGRTPRSAVWQLPLAYPAGLAGGDRWTPLMVLALSAGLLSFVLTPCLLQLIVIYVATLTGLTVEEAPRTMSVTGPRAVPADVGRRMVLVAAAFVAGFSVLFTVAGAAVGFAGKETQIFFAEWSRTVSIAAGLLVIALGIWVGIRSRAPLVCRIAATKPILSLDKRGFVGSMLMAGGFTLGCITCFGGAIIATMLIYVGALGSPLVGAVVMFTFSLGVGVPFFLAALFLSRVLPLMTRLAQYGPYLGFVSMVVIVAFGTLLLTDNFHVLSSFMYPYLGLK